MANTSSVLKGGSKRANQETHVTYEWVFDVDGNGTAVQLTRPGWYSFGPADDADYGTAGALTWQISLDGGTTYLTIGSSSTTAATDGTKTAWFPDEALVRPVLAGSTSPDLTCQLG